MNPMNSFDKFQIRREGLSWNERMVQRRMALVRSDSDSTNGKDSSPSAPPESLLPSPPPAPPPQPTKQCSSCSCRKSSSSHKKRSESRTAVQEKSKNKDYGLQQLEAKLYNAELEEAMHTERLERTHERLLRVAQLMDAQIMYTQSLHLKARAVVRMIQLVGNFTYKDLNPTETLAQTFDKICWDASVLDGLVEVQNVASLVNETPEQLYQLLEEFRDKKKDYQMASNTFGQYLRSTSRVSASQLRKYEAQYDSIRAAYDYSRHALETEFPKLIDERHEVLEHCFSKLIPLQEQILEQDRQFLTISKEISKTLQETSQKHRCRHNSEDKCQNPNSKVRQR